MLKEIENSLRSAVLRLLVRRFGGPPAPPVPDWSAHPRRVLFIRDDGIGDFIVSIEVMRAIAEIPGITLDVLCSPQNAPLARTLPFIHDVIVHRRTFLARSWPVWRRLRRARYDAVVDGRVAVRNVNMHTSALLLATAAPWRIGLGGRGNDQVYTVRIPEANLPHWTDQVVALASPFGIAPQARDWRPRISLPDDARAVAEREWNAAGGRPRVLLNLSVGHPERWWPPERYAPVLQRLRERVPHAGVMIVAMPADLPLAQELAHGVGGRAARLSLLEVIAAVASADLLISPDTSVTHAASAFATPTLTLQRQGTGQWSPYQTPGRVAFSDDPRAIRDMPADRVVRALDDLLDDIGRARGWLGPNDVS